MTRLGAALSDEPGELHMPASPATLRVATSPAERER